MKIVSALKLVNFVLMFLTASYIENNGSLSAGVTIMAGICINFFLLEKLSNKNF